MNKGEVGLLLIILFGFAICMIGGYAIGKSARYFTTDKRVVLYKMTIEQNLVWNKKEAVATADTTYHYRKQ